MPTQRYDLPSIALHWLVAFLVLATYAIGLGREIVPKGDTRMALLSLHMSLGLSVFALTVLRLVWRSARPAVTPVAAPRWAAIGSRATHLALYAALIALPLVGLASVWAKGRGVDVFGMFQLPSPISANRNLVEVLEELHEIGAHLMITLAGLHAAAALVHHYVLNDATLVRMLPMAKARHSAGTP